MADKPVTQMEFAVRMTCQDCVADIKRVLSGHSGIDEVFVNLENEFVLVKTSLPSSSVKELLESTGKLVIFRGYGGASDAVAKPTHHGAAVAIMKGSGNVKGLARLVQLSTEQCIVDGTVDGLTPEKTHFIKVHQFGDISDGCQSCGEVYKAGPDDEVCTGELGSVTADERGRGTFQILSNHLKVWDIIGRSMIVHSPTQQDRVMCGIIARSAGLFQNTKKVCTCDGVTLWEEEEKTKRSTDSDQMHKVATL